MKYTMTLIMLFALLFTGCGIHVSSDPVKVDGSVSGTVNHVVSIDANQVQQVLSAYCSSKYQTPTEANSCVAEQLALFWSTLNNSAPSGSIAPLPISTPAPTPVPN